VSRSAGWALALLIAPICAPLFAATRIDCDQGWLFRIDPNQTGEASGWTKNIPAETLAVSLPHTWNIGESHDYMGVAWYFRRFAMPPVSPQAHIELHFGATFYKARVWLNGVELGEHEGGFTEYSFDISSQVRGSNVLVVQIDNRPGAETIPGYGARGTPEAWYDWWAYGGIVRDVWLTETGPAWIRSQQIRSEQTSDRAKIRDHIFLQSDRRKSRAVIRVTAYDQDNQVVASASQPVEFLAGKADTVVSLTVSKPNLWSVDHPNMYRMDAELVDGNGKAFDAKSDTFGLRTLQILDRHLLLNGERVRLTGLARHEDSPWEGLAETRGTMQRDFDDMKALHATLTRPVHYPQNPYILDYADRHGILLIPEIPVWQFDEAQLSNEKVQALARQQMREMIEQAGNHPSIFAWSVANESATATPGGIAYFRMMRDFIRSIDPGRYVSYADDNLPKLDRAEQSAANDADFLMMNQYFGTWHGPASALVPALDRIDKLFPSKMAIVSEFGYPGFFAKNPSEADPERIKTLQEQMPLIAARDWIAGAILWCYQDYKSRRNLWPGQTEGYVEHGVVDEARQRKPSYGVWKEMNAPAKLDGSWVIAANSAVTGFVGTVTPNSQESLPYYPLRDYLLVWSLFDEKGRAISGGNRKLAHLSRAEQVAGTLPPEAPGHSLHMIFTLLDPTGIVAAERALEWPSTR
jgi:Glycosyl hydrolases family 2, TIM barrel domain/Glycosyl hydrolases family 2/Glycosyl hydrolases family 2, sugar binding domain